MDQVAVEAIAIVLLAGLGLLTLHISTIRPKLGRNREERRTLLNKELQSKISEVKDNNINITHLLPFFKEHEEMQSWKQQANLIEANLTFSFLLCLSSLFIGLLNFPPLIAAVQFETLLIVGGGLFLSVALALVIGLSRGIGDWRDENTKGNPS